MCTENVIHKDELKCNKSYCRMIHLGTHQVGILFSEMIMIELYVNMHVIYRALYIHE